MIFPCPECGESVSANQLRMHTRSNGDIVRVCTGCAEPTEGDGIMDWWVRGKDDGLWHARESGPNRSAVVLCGETVATVSRCRMPRGHWPDDETCRRCIGVVRAIRTRVSWKDAKSYHKAQRQPDAAEVLVDRIFAK